jgi:ligand-binding sensor domain-containing protein
MNGRRVYSIASVGGYLYAGTLYGFYRSTDNGESWQEKIIILSNLTVHSIAFVGGYLYAGTSDYPGTLNGVFRSTDNGESWQEKSIGLNNRAVYSIAFVGGNLYAGTSRGVYRSTDNGESWQEKSIGLNNLIVNSIAFVGGNLYAGTSRGVYRSTDNGESWSNIGLAGQDVRSLVSSGDYLFAGTNGKSVWKMPLSATNIEEREENTTLSSRILTYPNPSEGTLTIEIEDAHASNDIYDVMMYDMYGRNVGIYQIHNKQTIDVNTIPVGQYQLQVRNAQTQSIFAPSIFSIMR